MRYQVKKNIAGSYAVKFNCPNCAVKLSEALLKAGQADACPDCNTEFQVPGERELAEYQLRLQKRKDESAAKVAQKQAEADRVKQEKAAKLAVVADSPPKETASEVRPPTLPKEAMFCKSCGENITVDTKTCPICKTTTKDRPKPSKPKKIRHSGSGLGVFAAVAFFIALINFTLSSATETVLQEIVFTLRFYGAVVCGCILLVGSCLCFVIARK